MEDLRTAYRLAQQAVQQGSSAAPALVNELAEIIIDIPKPDKDGNCSVAIVGTELFTQAVELARPRITKIANLNAKAKFWAGYGVYGH